MPSSRPVLVWFREDLRLRDNPALHAASETGQPVICLYVLEDTAHGLRQHGGASLWWLHKSLAALSAEIAARGGALILRRGQADAILKDLVGTLNPSAIYWNRRYDAAGIEVDTAIKSNLKKAGIEACSFNGRLLSEPWTLKTKTGGYYRVFTPYWKALRAFYAAPEPLPAPDSLHMPDVESDALYSWGLLPSQPNWAHQFPDFWSPGEDAALERLHAFLDGPVYHYSGDRNRPDLDTSTSGLSPHLRWGEIGPAQIWRAVRSAMSSGEVREDSAWKFLSEVAWREFSYVLLYHNPQLASQNYNRDFQHMPWRNAEADYDRWCRGETGYPVVDAGMRQLWATGWMHNRVRMITASFLTKHLLIPWQRGEAWFWDTLVDADPASNAASWQWVAGSGADAAPYFRVFNPITQGEKFDVTGDYVRRWCPELADLPNAHLFAPWETPGEVLKDAGVELGKTYPHPMIEHKAGRQRALEAYETVKTEREAS
ncbi:MAG: DNA photolyase family protein [Hyphomonadaceae bacterium]|nr:DNA photolyase family protein [Hyphomonadaceae bacterium]